MASITPASIAAQAKRSIEANPQKHQKIQALKEDENAFFEYFIRKVKKNDYLKVSYILNHCFNDAVTRANFGNRSDPHQNTAYHHAASLGHREILIILNDKRPFHAAQKIFLFNKKNSKQQTPLDLCCLRGNEPGNKKCFLEIWKRAGKANHNPMLSLESACIGGSVEIVKRFLVHPKCDPNDESVNEVFLKTRSSQISLLLYRKMNPNSALHHAMDKNDIVLLKEYIQEKNVDLNDPNEYGWIILDSFHPSRVSDQDAFDMFSILIENGIDLLAINGKGECHFIRNILPYFLRKQWHNLLELIKKTLSEQIEKESYNQILRQIAKEGNRECLNFFYQIFQIPNEIFANICLKPLEEQEPPFFIALEQKNFPVAKKMITLGVDVNKQDGSGNTALNYAVKADDKDFVQFLLAQPQIKKTEKDLHLIAQCGSDQVIELILNRNVLDINAKNCDGKTAIQLAVKSLTSKDLREKVRGALIHIIRCLLKRGAMVDDVIITDIEKFVKAEQSSSSRFNELLEILKKHQELTQRKSEIEAINQQILDLNHPHLCKFHANFETEDLLKKAWEFINDCIAKNADQIEISGDDIQGILDKIRAEKYIDFFVLRLYEILQQVLCIALTSSNNSSSTEVSFSDESEESGSTGSTSSCNSSSTEVSFSDESEESEKLDEVEPTAQVSNPKYQNKIFDRHKESLSPITDHDKNFYFTLFPLKDKPVCTIRLTQVDQVPISNYLLTTLVYQATRHGFNCSKSKIAHQLLGKMDQRFKNNDLEKYKEDLLLVESSTGYSAENLSDDSDSEEEARWQNEPPRKKMLVSTSAENLLSRFGDNSVLKKNGEFKKAASTDHSQLQQIHRPQALTSQQQRDLDSLNAHIYRKTLTPDTLKTISTKFVIAQYRGVAYRTDQFSQKERQKHRVKNEISSPLLCTAAASQEKPVEYAATMQNQLFALKKSGPVFTRFNNGYLFANALEALQDLYSKDYEGFHAKSKAFFDKLNSGKDVIIDTLEDAILLNVNTDCNPFVSTSDTPDHALRYAYGSKYYASFKDLRLRPRWQSNGKAERPYSGKVYLSLHDPLELNDLSNHIPSLNQAGHLAIDNQTLPERETSFCAFIPKGKVISQLVAKFPSFHKDYKEIYLSKYGLDRNLFEKFKTAILGSKPHTPENRRYKDLLTEHLINFQEVGLIEEARIAAEKQGKVLLYRNSNGGFGLFPSETTEPTRGKNQERLEAAQEKRKQTNETRKRNRSESNSFEADKRPRVDGFLENLIRDFDIKCHARTCSLKDIILHKLELPEGSLPEIDDQEQWLENVAREHSLFIQVHSLENPKNPSKYGDSENLTHIYLYNFGSNRFAELIKK